MKTNNKTILNKLNINPLFKIKQQTRLRTSDLENNMLELTSTKVLDEAVTFRKGEVWVDTYLFGCVHNPSSNPFKSKLKKQKLWNRPYPMALSASAIELIVEHLKLLRVTHVNIGRKSDPLMMMDSKYGSTKLLLELLNKNGIEYTVYTQSDLCAYSDYKNLCFNKTVMRINSTDDRISKLKDPGAPSAKRRLKAAADINATIIKNWYALNQNPEAKAA